MITTQDVHQVDVHGEEGDVVARAKLRVYANGQVVVDVWTQRDLVISQIKLNGGARPASIVLQPREDA